MSRGSDGNVRSRECISCTSKHCHRLHDLATNMPFISRATRGVRRGELLKQLFENPVELCGRKIMDDDFASALAVDQRNFRPKPFLQPLFHIQER